MIIYYYCKAASSYRLKSLIYSRVHLHPLARTIPDGFNKVSEHHLPIRWTEAVSRLCSLQMTPFAMLRRSKTGIGGSKRLNVKQTFDPNYQRHALITWNKSILLVNKKLRSQISNSALFKLLEEIISDSFSRHKIIPCSNDKELKWER